MGDASAVAEGDDPKATADMSFTVSLSAVSGKDVTVPYTLGGTAGEGTDYETVSVKSVAIAAGASTGTIVIKVTGDTVDEADETVIVTLGTPTNATVSGSAGAGQGTGRITDDDATRGIAVFPNSLTLAESDDTQTNDKKENEKSYQISLSTQPSGTVTINLESADTAVAKLDKSSVKFTPTDWSSKSVVVTGQSDDLDNPDAKRTTTITHTVSAVNTDYHGETAESIAVTVTDDDGPPTISIDAPTVSEGDSGTNTLTYTVSLSSASGKVVTVLYADSLTGSATSATDYAAITSGTLTFSAGEKKKTVAVSVNGDEIHESDETIILRLSSPTNASFSGDNTNLDGIGKINDDDDLPIVTLNLSSASISENGGESTVTASLSAAASADISLTVSAVAVSPATTSDFSLSTNTILTIAAGSQSSTGTVSITAIDNSVVAQDKTITVSATATSGGVSNPTDLSLTIKEDDAAPTGITLSASPNSVAEGDDATTITVTATLQGDSRFNNDQIISVTVGDTNDSAVSGTDYKAVSDFDITIDAGDASGSETFTLEPIEDTAYESEESITIGGTNDDLKVTADSISLTDNDVAAILSVLPSRVNENAGATEITVKVSLNGSPRAQATPLTISVDPGTAQAADFEEVEDFTLTIPAQAISATKNFTFTPVDDLTDEPEESVIVSGTSKIDGFKVTSATLLIHNMDPPASGLTLEVSPTSVDENGGKQTITLTAKFDSGTRNEATDVSISIVGNTATQSDDFQPVSGFTITIPANQLQFSKDFAFTPIDDILVEGDETVTISGTTNVSDLTIHSGTLTIKDDDAFPTGIILSAYPETIAENSKATSTTVTATLQGGTILATDQIVAVTVGNEDDSATSGTDYEEVSSFDITIEAGAASGSNTFTLTPIDDSHHEREERISIDGTNEDLKVTSDSINITDNDVAATLSVSPAVIHEEDGATEITVTASVNGTTYPQATPLTISVSPGTAQATDFDAVDDFTLIIPAEATSGSATFILTPIDDLTDEPEESVIVSGASEIDGYEITPASVIIRNTDPEATDVTLTLTPASVAENGGAKTITLEAEIGPGTRGADTVVNISVVGKTATESQDFEPVPGFTITIPANQMAVSKVFTFTPVNDMLEETDETVEVKGTTSVSELNVQSGTLTIVNMLGEISLKPWIARFGRTVAEQVLDTVDNRIRTQRTSGLEVNLAGVNLNPLFETSSDQGDHVEITGTELREYGMEFGKERHANLLENGLDPHSTQTTVTRTVTNEEMLLGTSFSVATGDSLDGHYALWGKATRSDFEGRDSDTLLDGEVTSLLLGADWSQGDMTAGLIAANTKGEGSYGSDDGSSAQITATLSGLYPWGSYELSDRFTVWGVAGYANGALTLTPETKGDEVPTTFRTDLDFMMASVGLRGILIDGAHKGEFELALKADAMGMRATTDKALGLLAEDAEVTRLRFGIEGVKPFHFDDGSLLALDFEIGARHDDGDAETGYGVDVGAGVSWNDPGRGISADLRGRGLISHDSKEFENVGYSAMFSWDARSNKGSGAFLTLNQSIGSSSDNGVEALFGRRTLESLSEDDNGGDSDQQRFEMEFGYGISTFDERFTLTPRIGYGESSGQRDYSMNWQFARTDLGNWTLEINVQRSWFDDGGNIESENSLGLQFGTRW
ncbi:MAG: hypothetical protein OXI60_04120 [Acidiferrobacterales bacterium]|nr:hypothetical protein [Acidiferrobacterales bacterium]